MRVTRRALVRAGAGSKRLALERLDGLALKPVESPGRPLAALARQPGPTRPSIDRSFAHV